MPDPAFPLHDPAHALDRIGEIDPVVNAVAGLDEDAARTAGPDLDNTPLSGMPLLVKDNIETAGSLPTTAGSLALRRNVTDRDATVVRRLKAAGAVVLGKAAMSEWANFRSNHPVSGWSATGGLTRNPHALDRVAGSSSSGSAVAVATGMVPAAIGTETSGSITSPASINGVVGMKPTVGLVSRRHILPISYSQGTPGPLARSVSIAARVLAAMAGTDPLDPATIHADEHAAKLAAALDPALVEGMRIGVMRFAVPSSTAKSFEEALDVFRALGAELVDIADFDTREEIIALDRTVMLSEFKASLDNYMASTDPALVEPRSLAEIVEFNERHAKEELALFGQDILLEALEAPPMDDTAYLAARDRSCRMAGKDGIDCMLADCGARVLMGPTQRPAIKLDVVNRRPHMIDSACLLAAVTGYPHLSVPMRPVRRLPVGLSIVGPKWSDALVLSVGHAYEREAALRIEPGYIPSLEESEPVRSSLGRQRID